MGEFESASLVPSTALSEQLFQETKFGTVVRALWPDKPALNLAQRMGVNPATRKPYTERNALQIIRGERRVTARAVAVVVNEMLD